jgi:hypothetical protein
MKPLNPIRLHAALRGGLRIGTRVVPLPAVGLPNAHRAGFRNGGLQVPN